MNHTERNSYLIVWAVVLLLATALAVGALLLCGDSHRSFPIQTPTTITIQEQP